jgi:hypothetical protein
MSPRRRWLDRLSRRDRRALGWAVMLLAPALLFSLALDPYLARLAGLRERTHGERELLRREGGLLADRRGFTARYAAAEHGLLTVAPQLFGGPDAISASGALSTYLSGLAIRHRVFVQASETRPAEVGEAGLVKLVVDLRAVGDLEGIVGFLDALESGPKRASVERLLLSRAERLGVGQPRDEEVLGMAVTVSGFSLVQLEEGKQ